MISPGKDLWHCLGACGEGGSGIDWVMKTHGVTFRNAVDDVEQAIDVANETPSVLSVPVITRDVDSGLRSPRARPRLGPGEEEGYGRASGVTKSGDVPAPPVVS